MRTHVLVLTTSALILIGATTLAIAQQGAGSPMMQQPSHEQTQQQGSGQGSMAGQRGMMGPGMMGQGMMGQGMMGQGNMMGMMGQREMGGGMSAPMGMTGRPLMMRIMFILMDTDGDGTVSLQEFQAAHERIFKAMDSNKVGRLTFEEMQSFMQGAGRSMPQQ
jgi:hypothetical protein